MPRDIPPGYPENNLVLVAAVLAGLIVLFGLAIFFGWVNP